MTKQDQIKFLEDADLQEIENRIRFIREKRLSEKLRQGRLIIDIVETKFYNELLRKSIELNRNN